MSPTGADSASSTLSDMSTEGSGQEWPQYEAAQGQDPVQDPAQKPGQDPYGTGSAGAGGQWQSYDKAPTPQSSFGPPQLPGPDSKRNAGTGGAVLVAIGVILLIIMFAVVVG